MDLEEITQQVTPAANHRIERYPCYIVFMYNMHGEQLAYEDITSFNDVAEVVKRSPASTNYLHIEYQELFVSYADDFPPQEVSRYRTFLTLHTYYLDAVYVAPDEFDTFPDVNERLYYLRNVLLSSGYTNAILPLGAAKLATNLVAESESVSIISST